ncbi:MAG: lysine--tRNA ligase [Rickettsiales bacterium]|jgi:lysyl-tRNA synthetase class 1|nr:lysine--tRNA ligase [Rickettsiales bacterium]
MADGAMHWSDLIAERIIKEHGDKPLYTLASGITPSGTIHIGKFREIITTEMVSRALVRAGKNVRFIYSWDDYDTFRKVPADMPDQEKLKAMLYQPIVDIPDVYGTAESYARHNEITLEEIAPVLGITNIEFIYQSKMYRAKKYNDMIIRVADNAEKIRAILQEYKTQEIDADWFPIETYCEKCNRDRVKFSNYDSAAKTIDYECKLCGHKETLNLRESTRLKLPWRVDWPMRWAFEKVDFEPGGTDHSSAGGSFDTGRGIAREIFDWAAPVYAKYAFVLPKGQKKKMSSSVGNGFSVDSVLEVYTPEMVRWFFASYKPDAPFNMAFDIDVLKNYENFDKMERVVYGAEGDNDDKRAAWRRVYEMSQIAFNGEIPATMPFQPSFRHLCNNLQTNGMDIEKTRAVYASEIKNDVDEARYRERAKRAAFWIENYAPDDFVFRVNDARRDDFFAGLADNEKKFVAAARAEILAATDEQELQAAINAAGIANGVESKRSYRIIYQMLISRDVGPKLAAFIFGVGPARAASLL